jgi:hypothetical protein
MINNKNTIRLLVGLISLVIIFHILVLVKIVPFGIAWGGRLKSAKEMYVFESISTALNLFLIWILLLKSKNVKSKLIDFTLWIFFVVFSLNTIGNLVAHTNLEKCFSILTLIFALLLLKILTKRKQ